jgi:hypothetical protein
MRLTAQMKLGFYPAHPRAIELLCKHLLPASGEATILDPCVGKGHALQQIIQAIGIAPDRVYAVELDEYRAGECRKTLGEEANILGPASFKGSRITGDNFSIAYVNPPFDDEMGGGKREELAFAQIATQKLVNKGILVLVLPLTAIERNRDFQDFLDSHYDEAAFFEFPAGLASDGETVREMRPYREVVYIGRKRPKPVEKNWDGFLNGLDFGSAYRVVNFPVLGTLANIKNWTLPPGRKPYTFKKIDLTEAEMLDYCEKSKLNDVFLPPPELTVDRPPLPPYTGHVAQLLASGMLNGVIEVPGEPPHVVRGTSQKENVKDSVTPTFNAQGDQTGQKEVWIQIIKLTVRVIGLDGLIKTFVSVGKEKT